MLEFILMETHFAVLAYFKKVDKSMDYKSELLFS